MIIILFFFLVKIEILEDESGFNEMDILLNIY